MNKRGILWRGRLWWFAGGAPDGDGQGGQTGESTATGDATGQAGGGPTGNGGTDDKRFSQAEVDAIVQDRLRRANESADRKTEADRKKADEAAAAQRGEYQKLAEERGQRIADIEAELERERIARREALIRAAVEREAHAQGAVKADVVYRLVDRSAVQIDDSGEAKGADKAVKALLEAEPYLKVQQGSGTLPVPGTPKPNGQGGRDSLIAKTKEEMRASGRYGF